MFTGIIYFLGTVSSSSGGVLKVIIDSFHKPAIGQSVAINGVCLTVTHIQDNVYTFHVMLETLGRTNLGLLKSSDKVHVEFALESGSRFDGHVLSGHVSSVVWLARRTENSDGSLTLIYYLKDACPYLKFKGSVALDGISLTVAALSTTTFTVCLIPHTRKVTLLDTIAFSRPVNIELEHHENIPFDFGTIDFMKQALSISKQGKSSAPPNPWVGAIILDENGTILSQGYHEKRGLGHAEHNAFLALSEGNKTLVHTMYVTLEPCSNCSGNKLQPPCVDALIASPIQNIIVGMSDPDKRMSGQGLEKLKQSGRHVTCVEDARIRHSLRAYCHHRKTGLPYVTAKLGLSLDGHIALPSGESQWITGQASRLDARNVREKCQAILVGTKTALLDKPRLTRNKEGFYFRCFIDRKGLVTDGPLLDISLGPVIVFTTTSCNLDTLNLWKEKQLEIAVVKDISDILTYLGDKGVLRLLVEGGATLLSSFLEQGLVNELFIYRSGLLLGKDSQQGLAVQSPPVLSKAKQLKLRKVKQLDHDVKSIYDF